MKVETGDIVTRIYPFVEPDGKPGRLSSYIIIYPHAIRIVSEGAMSTEAARKLAEALLHASKIAQNGQK